MAKKNSNDPFLAPVDEYPERPYDEAKDDHANEPREQVDQIADYHQKHPTLKTDGKENDPAFIETLYAGTETPDPQEPTE